MKKLIPLILLITTPVFAQTPEQWKPERYYVKLGLGIANLSYAGEERAIIKAINEQPGVSNDTYAVDMAFYKSMNDTNALGLSLTGISDLFEAKGEELSVTQSQLGGSYHHAFDRLGRGLFSRVDAGIVRYSVEYDSVDLKVKDKSKIGVGALTALGYHYELNTETAIELQLALSYRRAEAKTTGLAFTIGVFF